MKQLHIELGQLIRDHRMKQGMTQLELATKLGYDSMQFVSLFERGISKVPSKVIGKLVMILGIPEKKVVRMITEDFIFEMTSEIVAGQKELQ